MKARLTFKKADPWSGFTIYKNCRHAIGTYIKRSGQYYTGLENDDLVREELESKLKIDLSPSSSFWDTFYVFLTDKDVTIDTSIPEEKLQYYFLKGHKRVAMGLSDIKPSTDYVLLQEEEEAREKNVKSRIKIKAVSEFSKMSPEQMRKALRLYGYNSSNTAIEVVESTLFKLIEDDPQKFNTLWVDNKNKNTQFLIEEAVAKGILRKVKSTYKYGSDVIGYNLENTIDHLDNPTNNDLKMAIKAQLESKDIVYGDTPKEEESTTSQFSKLMNEIEKDNKK